MSLTQILWQNGFRGFTPNCSQVSNPKRASAPNVFIWAHKFHMKSFRSIIASLYKGNFLAFVDIRDMSPPFQYISISYTMLWPHPSASCLYLCCLPRCCPSLDPPTLLWHPHCGIPKRPPVEKIVNATLEMTDHWVSGSSPGQARIFFFPHHRRNFTSSSPRVFWLHFCTSVLDLLVASFLIQTHLKSFTPDLCIRPFYQDSSWADQFTWL